MTLRALSIATPVSRRNEIWKTTYCNSKQAIEQSNKHKRENKEDQQQPNRLLQ